MDSTEENPEIQVSSPSEIRAKSQEKKLGKLLKLPSGFVVRVGDPDVIEMVRTGAMPGDLIEIALNLKDNKEMAEDPANMPKFFDFLAKMVIAVVTEPVIVEKDPTESQIALSDLSFEDKMVIFNDWRTEGEALATFREEQQSKSEIVGPSMQEVSE